MINETEEALKHVIEEARKVINNLTLDDPETRHLLHMSLVAIAAGSFKVGYTQGRLRGRAE